MTMHTAKRAGGPPPEDARRSSPWSAVARAAKAEPGEWFEVDGVHATSVATYLRREWDLEVRPVNGHDTEVNGKTVRRCTIWVMAPVVGEASIPPHTDTDEPATGEGSGESEPEAYTSDIDPEAPEPDPDEDDGWADAVVNPDEIPVA